MKNLFAADAATRIAKYGQMCASATNRSAGSQRAMLAAIVATADAPIIPEMTAALGKLFQREAAKAFAAAAEGEKKPA